MDNRNAVSCDQADSVNEALLVPNVQSSVALQESHILYHLCVCLVYNYSIMVSRLFIATVLSLKSCSTFEKNPLLLDTLTSEVRFSCVNMRI